MAFKSDIEIAQEAKMLHIRDVAEGIGIAEDDLEFYGKYKAKLTEEYLKKVQSKVSGTVNKNAKWADLMSAAAFIGLIAAFLGRGIAGIGEVQVNEAGEKINAVVGDGAGILSITAIVSSVLFMLLLTWINKKLQWKWLEAFAMPLAMLLSMGVIVLLSTYAPDLAAIEWRY